MTKEFLVSDNLQTPMRAEGPYRTYRERAWSIIRGVELPDGFFRATSGARIHLTVKGTVPAPGGDKEYQLITIEALDLVKHGSMTVLHAPVDVVKALFVDGVYQQALDAALVAEGDERWKKAGELHWWLAQATPHTRGGGAIAELMALAVLDYYGLTYGPWKLMPWGRVTSWAEAQIRSKRDFADSYKSFFEHEAD